jgi:hypothetical protein
MLRRSMLKTLKARYMELQNLRELVRAAEEKSDLRFGDRRKERSFTAVGNDPEHGRSSQTIS